MHQALPLSAKPDGARLAELRAQVASAASVGDRHIPFGVPELDGKLVGEGLNVAGLHEFAAASSTLCDDAATTLFAAGIAARAASAGDLSVLWILTKFDLFAPGLEQVGLGPDRILYAQGKKDIEVLAMAEDGLRSGALACVVAEVRAADQTMTRRLQLAAAEGQVPMLLYRRHRSAERCPLSGNSAAMTRWRIGSVPSQALPVPGVGRGRWSVELVRQRGGNPFTLELEACDDQGRLALPAHALHRAAAAAGATHRAA